MAETLLVGGLTVVADRSGPATHSPVLFIPGYFADAFVFDRWLPFFAARGFPAFAVNLRGRAGSSREIDVGRVRVGEYVEDALRIARWIGRPLVVGHSMGGLIAQKLAEQGDARAVALMCPAPPRGIPVLSWRLLAKQVKYLPALLASRPLRPSRADAYDLVLNRVPAEERDAIFARLVPDSGRAGREMSILGVPVDASRVRCPIFVVTCDDDRFIPKRVVKRIAERYHAPLQTMIGHGHMLPCEPGWEVAADVVVRWFMSLRP